MLVVRSPQVNKKRCLTVISGFLNWSLNELPWYIQRKKCGLADELKFQLCVQSLLCLNVVGNGPNYVTSCILIQHNSIIISQTSGPNIFRPVKQGAHTQKVVQSTSSYIKKHLKKHCVSIFAHDLNFNQIKIASITIFKKKKKEKWNASQVLLTHISSICFILFKC